MYSNAALSTKLWFHDTELTEVISTENTAYHLREMNEERRTAVRHNVNEGTYAVIASINPQVCQILNISSDGMAFIYYNNDEVVDFKFDTLDIVVQGDGFCLENVLFEKVSDFKIGEMDGCGFEKRIANIRFIDQNEDSRGKINEFIRNYFNKTVN